MITNQESLPNKYYGSDSTNFLNDFEKLIKEIYKKQINDEKANDKHSYYNKQNYTNNSEEIEINKIFFSSNLK